MVAVGGGKREGERGKEGDREIYLLGSICKMEIKSMKVNTLEDVQRIVKKKEITQFSVEQKFSRRPRLEVRRCLQHFTQSLDYYSRIFINITFV